MQYHSKVIPIARGASAATAICRSIIESQSLLQSASAANAICGSITESQSLR
jgi:hypothetical protein